MCRSDRIRRLERDASDPSRPAELIFKEAAWIPDELNLQKVRLGTGVDIEIHFSPRVRSSKIVRNYIYRLCVVRIAYRNLHATFGSYLIGSN